MDYDNTPKHSTTTISHMEHYTILQKHPKEENNNLLRSTPGSLTAPNQAQCQASGLPSSVQLGQMLH